MTDSFILFLAIISFFFFLIATRIKTGRILSINIVYSILWIVILFMSMNNNLGLIKPRTSIYILVLISIIIFNIIYLFFDNSKISKNINFEAFSINEKKIFYLNIISYFLVAPFMLQALKLILSYGFDLVLIRNTIYVGITDSGNSVVSILCRTLPTAIFNFTSIISSYYLITKKNKKIIVLGILDVIIGTLIFGGRNFLLNYVIFYVFHFLSSSKVNKIKIKKRYIFLLVLLLFIVTKNRDVSEISFIQTIILYFAGSLSFLEYMLRVPYLYGLDVKYFGYLTFGFITEPIVIALKTFFGSTYRVPSYYFNIYAQKFVNIGLSDVYLYNNNSTFFYPFMLDFGISYAFIGVFIYSLLISLVSRLKNKGNLRFYFIYIYFCSSVVNSSVSYKLIGLSASIIIFLVFYIIERKKEYEF